MKPGSGAGTSVQQELPGSYNGFVYVLEGEGKFGADAVAGHSGQTLWIDRLDAEIPTALTLTAVTDLRVLVAAGRPVQPTLTLRKAAISQRYSSKPGLPGIP